MTEDNQWQLKVGQKSNPIYVIDLVNTKIKVPRYKLTELRNYQIHKKWIIYSASYRIMNPTLKIASYLWTSR